jgi:hypothetical protein
LVSTGTAEFKTYATNVYRAAKEANKHRLAEWRQELCTRALELRLEERPLNPAEDAVKNMRKVEQKAAALVRLFLTPSQSKPY